MIALLGLLAVAGYQNRDRLGELFGRLTGRQDTTDRLPGEPERTAGTQAAGGGGLGGLLGGLGSLFGGTGSAGAGISGGLSDLIQRITGNGHGETARSWVETGPNRELETGQLEEALGADTIDSLRQQTGLSREELLARLKSVLPTAVDKLTPDGRLPSEADAAQWVSRAA